LPPATAGDTWAPAPLAPRLAEGIVHVWRADLSAVSDELIELLCPEERARAERIVGESKRRVWARAHGVLRELLGRYLQENPRALRFTAGAHGKPALLDGPLRFNLAHSGQCALYALTEGISVGVDVEVARRPIDEVALATRVFGEAEAQRLQRLDPATREQEFLRAWVRREAELKCLGTGIGGASPSDGASNHGLWIAELDVGPRAAAAVAAPGDQHELRCWDWRM
jgi:4'-phosphopantetheinyl transferase